MIVLRYRDQADSSTNTSSCVICRSNSKRFSLHGHSVGLVAMVRIARKACSHWPLRCWAKTRIRSVHDISSIFLEKTFTPTNCRETAPMSRLTSIISTHVRDTNQQSFECWKQTARSPLSAVLEWRFVDLPGFAKPESAATWYFSEGWVISICLLSDVICFTGPTTQTWKA
jgi:hypothetical protein